MVPPVGLVGVRAMSCQVEQHAGLAPYEIERAENIRRNNAFLLNLGLLDEHALRAKPKKPKAAPKPKPEPTGPRRSSGRLSGEAPEEPFGIEPAAADDQPDEPDPFFCWWTATEENPAGETRPPLTDEQKSALMTPLTAEQREAIVFPEGSASAMVQDAMVFLRSYVSGSQTLRLLAAGSLTATHACPGRWPCRRGWKTRWPAAIVRRTVPGQPEERTRHGWLPSGRRGLDEQLQGVLLRHELP